MKTKILVVLIIISTGFQFLHAQVFKKPSESKASVYFVRTSRMGYAINFKYFDKDKFIGIFNNKGYIRYDCDPGEHILWMFPGGGGGKADYIIGLLEEGKTYVVEVQAKGKLNPVSPDEEIDILENTIKVVSKKDEVTMSEEDMAKRNIDYAEFIEKELSKFELLTKEQYPFQRISSEHTLPDKYIIK